MAARASYFVSFWPVPAKATWQTFKEQYGEKKNSARAFFFFSLNRYLCLRALTQGSFEFVSRMFLAFASCMTKKVFALISLRAHRSHQKRSLDKGVLPGFLPPSSNFNHFIEMHWKKGTNSKHNERNQMRCFSTA